MGQELNLYAISPRKTRAENIEKQKALSKQSVFPGVGRSLRS